MMKIRVRESGTQSTLYVEGELAGTVVCELERCWRSLGDTTGRKLVLSLKDLVRIDRTGRQLLRSMHEQGVTFVGAHLAMEDVLDEITSSDLSKSPQAKREVL